MSSRDRPFSGQGLSVLGILAEFASTPLTTSTYHATHGKHVQNRGISFQPRKQSGALIGERHSPSPLTPTLSPKGEREKTPAAVGLTQTEDRRRWGWPLGF